MLPFYSYDGQRLRRTTQTSTHKISIRGTENPCKTARFHEVRFDHKSSHTLTHPHHHTYYLTTALDPPTLSSSPYLPPHNSYICTHFPKHSYKHNSSHTLTRPPDHSHYLATSVDLPSPTTSTHSLQHDSINCALSPTHTPTPPKRHSLPLMLHFTLVHPPQICINCVQHALHMTLLDSFTSRSPANTQFRLRQCAHLP